ncbi:hypothetical protein ABZW32_38220 [Streptomyces sp. NPDC004667]|uniref:hypothetical protein n=1 Tax=Streptomyces sp. NPDC004667 TaxID=3154285 RepID=UPI0033BCBA23
MITSRLRPVRRMRAAWATGLAAIGVLTLTTVPSHAADPTGTPASVRTVAEPHCGGEWTDYRDSNQDRRMKSWLCFYDSGDGGVYPTLWTECGWWKIIGWAAPPNGCRIWEPSSYEITFPDGTKTKDAVFPGASGSDKAATNGASYPCQSGPWKLWSYYGVQMKDVLGNWGSSVAATHEVTIDVTCP